MRDSAALLRTQSWDELNETGFRICSKVCFILKDLRDVVTARKREILIGISVQVLRLAGTVPPI